jgi:phosphoribosyl 1,2-cyclic phosphodiesterase
MIRSMSLCVLGSGSGGNCSALVLDGEAGRRVVLIDLGLSKRQTNLRLGKVGLSLDDVTDALVTHLDTDHFCTSWHNRVPDHIELHLHRRHAQHACQRGLVPAVRRAYDRAFDLHGCRVEPLLVSHDALGTVAFRISTAAGDLGFITDCGKVTRQLVRHVQDVDVLAIESNYDPRMQVASGRPRFLVDRIMGGSGHLSNEEAREAVRAIRPRRRVVLLHLSRQCNRPECITRLYEDGERPGPEELVISNQFTPAPWVHVHENGLAATTGGLIPANLFTP